VPLAGDAAPFAGAISVIVARRAREKMLDVDAQPIVAGVAQNYAVVERPSSLYPR
jgi:hypothetical protein